MRKKYIVFAPSYDENVGGSISMHRLCHLLNTQGEEAYLWHDGKSKLIKNKDFITPDICTKQLDDFIVVYMDVVSGNPLDCPHVVRWFLNKPGFFTGNINYGEQELYFFFQEVFKHEQYIAKEKLYVAYFLTDLFKNEQRGSREGSCYMMRKGAGRKIQHSIDNSIMLDGKSHREIAEIFNQKKYFYCYDLHSAYTYFSALCGCIPIVVPQDGLSESDWQPEERLRYGVAYGDSLEQLFYAKKTRIHLIKLIDDLAVESESYVEQFIETSQTFFAENGKSKAHLDNEKLGYFEALKNSQNQVVFFGASEALRSMYAVLNMKNVHCDFICDNSVDKHGKQFLGKFISDPNVILNRDGHFDVLITTSYHKEIRVQLQQYQSVKNIYSLF